MSDDGRKKMKKRAQWACCAIFLLVLFLLILILYFSVYKPDDPSLHVTDIRLGTVPAQNNNLALTFIMTITLYNPNRDDLRVRSDSYAVLSFLSQQPLTVTLLPSATVPARAALSASIRLGNAMVPTSTFSSSEFQFITVVTVFTHIRSGVFFSQNFAVTANCSVAVFVAVNASNAALQSLSCQYLSHD